MIRKTIETYAFTCGIAVTISLGIAAKNKNEAMEDCVGRADKKLYEAKAAGRNRICW
jgi:diguanylate cyclase (GGDEF)-like protein